jgi:segregation and condensation protein B
MANPNPRVTIAVDNDAIADGISPEERRQSLRMAEALLFASAEPIVAEDLASRLPNGSDVAGILRELQQTYATRGVNLVQVAGKWMFRTAGDLSFLLSRDAVEQKKLSRAALETLAIIAYQQPVTRAEIEAVRGVAVGQGTLDILVDAGWVAPKGRREAPGRPVTWVTTQAFLDHFALASLEDLPRLDELEGASLFNPRGEG